MAMTTTRRGYARSTYFAIQRSKISRAQRATPQLGAAARRRRHDPRTQALASRRREEREGCEGGHRGQDGRLGSSLSRIAVILRGLTALSALTKQVICGLRRRSGGTNAPLRADCYSAMLRSMHEPGQLDELMICRLDAGRRELTPCSIVIFGASGDLTARKLIPAL